MDIENISNNLPVIWNELKIEYYDELTSTNDQAKQFLKENSQKEVLIISKKQTKGRGRAGRTFYSQLDHGLYFSLVIHPKNVEPKDIPLYTIATATAMIQAVEKVLAIELKIKWVNDLFYQGRKVSGILSEAITNPEKTTISSIIIGVGLNLAGSFNEANSQTQEIAGTLYEELPTDFEPYQLLQEFLTQFGHYHQNLTVKEFLPLYEKKLLGMGQHVKYERKNKYYHGVIEGINEHGHLLVRNKQGQLQILLGEEIHFSSKQFKKN